MLMNEAHDVCSIRHKTKYEKENLFYYNKGLFRQKSYFLQKELT